MRDLAAEAKAQYKELIKRAAEAAVSAGELPAGELPEFIVEVPADSKNGNLASNAAMVSARAFRKAPRQIAEAIAAHLELEGSYFERAEVAGPGFLNVFYAPHWYAEAINAAVSEASHMSSYDDMAEGYSVAEQMLLQAMPALPLFYETSYFAVSKNISGLDYSVFGGHIVFRFCE